MTPDQIRLAAHRNAAKKAQELHRLAPVRAAAKDAAALLRERAGAAKVRIAEVKQMNDLVYIPGFFPTPKRIVERMMEIAKIEPGMLCLEPSAGKGDIADAMAAALNGCGRVVTCEINYQLQQILRKKGHWDAGESGDFMEMKIEPVYARILANPPFEKGQDRIHVRRMYDMLKPGGRLVAIVSEGCFSRSQKADLEFQKWLNDIGADHEENPEDAFSGAGSERRTAVRTRIITIDKE